MGANDYQVGGGHYQKEYQHWDFVHDVNMPYHLGCATKYISRWRDKNGIQDLQKALHYIAKTEELGIDYSRCRWHEDSKQRMSKFAIQIGVSDPSAGAFTAICRGDYDNARKIIHELIEELLDEERQQQEVSAARGREDV